MIEFGVLSLISLPSFRIFQVLTMDVELLEPIPMTSIRVDQHSPFLHQELLDASQDFHHFLKSAGKFSSSDVHDLFGWIVTDNYDHEQVTPDIIDSQKNLKIKESPIQILESSKMTASNQEWVTPPTGTATPRSRRKRSKRTNTISGTNNTHDSARTL